MEDNSLSEKKQCFIVTPIGGQSSATRRETDGLIKTVFAPALDKFGFTVVAAHQISETGSITRQVVRRIIEADLVIANLTELNPNVMYELGIRHCARKPIIVVAREDVNLPFDLSDERTIFYKNDMFGVDELRISLDSMIPLALKDITPDNPVYRVVDYDLIRYTEAPRDIEQVMDMRLRKIEDRLEEISRQGRVHGLDTIGGHGLSNIRSTFVQTGQLNKVELLLSKWGVSFKYDDEKSKVNNSWIEIKLIGLNSSEIFQIEKKLADNGIELLPF